MMTVASLAGRAAGSGKALAHLQFILLTIVFPESVVRAGPRPCRDCASGTLPVPYLPTPRPCCWPPVVPGPRLRVRHRAGRTRSGGLEQVKRAKERGRTARAELHVLR